MVVIGALLLLGLLVLSVWLTGLCVSEAVNALVGVVRGDALTWWGGFLVALGGFFITLWVSVAWHLGRGGRDSTSAKLPSRGASGNLFPWDKSQGGSL